MKLIIFLTALYFQNCKTDPRSKIRDRAIIKTSQAIEPLKNGLLGYLGIDVYEDEENLFFKNLSEKVVQDESIKRLMSFNNVLISSNIGFFRKKQLPK
jgi:D-lactate dehydrogenase